MKNNLKKLRKERNLKQIDLAKEVGVTRQSMSYYELGMTRPSLDKAKKIADVLDCTIEDIFFDN